MGRGSGWICFGDGSCNRIDWGDVMSNEEHRNSFRFQNWGKQLSRKQRKIDAQKETINHLHDRLAALKSSNRNKASQVARLKALLAKHGICESHPNQNGCGCGIRFVPKDDWLKMKKGRDGQFKEIREKPTADNEAAD